MYALKDLHPNGSHSSIIMILEISCEISPHPMAAKVMSLSIHFHHSWINFIHWKFILSHFNTFIPWLCFLNWPDVHPHHSIALTPNPYSNDSPEFHTELLNLQNWILDKKVYYIRVIRKVTLSSPCLWASFHPPPILSFTGIRKVKTFY
jgi:hypothetical protein